MNLATMKPLPLWSRLWGRPRRPASLGSDRLFVLRLQPRGLADTQLRHLEQLLQPLGERLSIEWDVVAADGDVLVVARGCEGDPSAASRGDTLVCDLPRADEAPTDVAARFERRQRALLAQLRALPQVRRRSPHFGASGWDPAVADTVPAGLDAIGHPHLDDDALWQAPSLPLEDERLLLRVRRAYADGSTPLLSLSYGPQASIEFDFAFGQAWLDLAALRALRVEQRLPVLAEPRRAGPEAVPIEPAAVLWDLGLVAGKHRLLDQPNDWWNVRVATPAAAQLMRHATLPRHRRLAAVLAAGPTTALDLMRLSGVSLPHLRSFTQAGLMLDLLRWQH
jgi:hypothetical protein